MPSASLGIDIGSTFTSLVLHEAGHGRGGSLKVLTTPADPTLGVLEGVRRLLAEANVEAADIARLVHASTLLAGTADDLRPGACPPPNGHLSRLAAALAAMGIAAPLAGPAGSGADAALLAAAELAGREEPRILALDMGGTLAKLGLVEHGELEAPPRAVAAGGGSVAWMDSAGLPRVGPQSAGAEPGSASHGHGGRAPTVTDANLLLGYLDAAPFPGSRLALDRAAAEVAVGSLAARLRIGVEAAAWAIHDAVTEAMATGARAQLAERGWGAPGVTLVCTGGGGAVHGHHLARKLGIHRLVVPPGAGFASALGLLIAPRRTDRAVAIGRALPACSAAMLDAAFDALEAEARGGWTGGEPLLRHMLDMRRVGEETTLPVALPPRPWPGDDAALHAMVRAAFHAAAPRRCHRASPAGTIELLRARILLRERPGYAVPPFRPRWGGPPRAHQRPIFWEGRRIMADIYCRGGLLPGFTAPGPALVEEAGSTLVVGTGGRFTVLDSGNIVVEEASGG